MLTFKEGHMFIRKAVTLFLELWSAATSVETALGETALGETALVETECVVDWRWFME